LPEPELPPPAADEADGIKAQIAQRYEQDIHFCMTPDGVRLAYSLVGGGPPLVKTGNWMTHLEFDFEPQSGDLSIASFRAITHWSAMTRATMGSRTATLRKFHSRHS